MNHYQNVMLATNPTADIDQRVITRGLKFAKQCGAKISLVHAVEHITNPNAAAALAVLTDIEAEQYLQEKEQVSAIADEIGVEESARYIRSGKPAAVIAEEAYKHDTDLLVIGNHKHRFWHFLKHSTVNAVLHELPCDVLVVKE